MNSNGMSGKLSHVRVTQLILKGHGELSTNMAPVRKAF